MGRRHPDAGGLWPSGLAQMQVAATLVGLVTPSDR
jgi:hypothetical protein